MGELKVGQQVGTWRSNAGEASIKVQAEIGTGYQSKTDAVKAAHGQQAVITKEADGQFHAYAIDDGAYFDDLDLGEKVSSKSKQVVDFVGDDDHEVIAKRKTWAPTGPDNGKIVYFMRHLANAWQSGVETAFNPDTLQADEIAKLRQKGYTVVVDFDATKKEMQEAFYDPRTAGVIFHGHGDEDSVMTANSDGDDFEERFTPFSLDAAKVSPHLKLVLFQACDAMKSRKDWEAHLPGAKVYGWDRSVSLTEVAASNGHAFWDLVSGPSKGDVQAKKAPDRLERLIDQDL